MIIQVRKQNRYSMLSRVQCLGISEVRIKDNRYIKRFEGAIIALRGALIGAQKEEEKR